HRAKCLQPRLFSHEPPVTVYQSRLIGHQVSVTKLPPRQLEEYIFEIRMPVQIAHVAPALELVHERIGVARVAEHRLAGALAALAQRSPERFRPALRAVAVDLDHLRLD